MNMYLKISNIYKDHIDRNHDYDSYNNDNYIRIWTKRTMHVIIRLVLTS